MRGRHKQGKELFPSVSLSQLFMAASPNFSFFFSLHDCESQHFIQHRLDDTEYGL